MNKELKDALHGFTLGLIGLVVIGLALAASAAPNFVTPNMMKRNGLTDEQYQFFWKLGKNPHVDLATARDWYFRSRRYENVTNWLEVVGKTNDFARLVVPTMTTNEWLTATNRTLKTRVVNLTRAVEDLEPDAKELRKAVKAAEKAAKKDEKNFEKWVKDTKKARDKSSEEMAEFYDAIIEIATGEVPNE